MAYEVVMPYHLHMPSYFLGTFTEYPFLVYPKKTNLSLSKTNLLYRFLNDVANLKSYFKVLFDIYQKRIIS